MIFISYRRSSGRHFAGRLKDALQPHFAVFLDTDIGPGARFEDRIALELHSATIVLVVIEKNWLGSGRVGRRKIDNDLDWVHREVKTALSDQSKRVIPVLVDDAQMPNIAELPEPLQRLSQLNAHRVRHDCWSSDISALRQDFAASEPASPRRPYRRRPKPWLAAAAGLLVLIAAGTTWAWKAFADDIWAEDAGMAHFAGNFRNIVGDCRSPDTNRYKRDIGIDPPHEGDTNLIVRCDGDNWAVFFISFTDPLTRADLYNAVRDDNHRSGECASWGSDQGQAKRPTDEKAQARVCFKAGGGLGIYWEPAVDGQGRQKYAGVMVARGTDNATLQTVWNDQT